MKCVNRLWRMMTKTVAGKHFTMATIDLHKRCSPGLNASQTYPDTTGPAQKAEQ